MSDATKPLPEAEADSVISVLVVDDAVIDRRMTGTIIEQHLGWRVTYAEDGAAALAAMERQAPRLVLTDMRMPGMDGLALVAAVRRRFPAVPVVLMTAYGNEEIAMQALREGPRATSPRKARTGTWSRRWSRSSRPPDWNDTSSSCWSGCRTPSPASSSTTTAR